MPKTPLEYKNEGNTLLSQNKPDAAISAYSCGVAALEGKESKSTEEVSLHAVLLANRAQANINAKKWADAVKDATESLAVGPDGPVASKCIFRRATAGINMKTSESVSRAYEDVCRLSEIEGWAKEVESFFRELRRISAELPIVPKLSFRHRALARGRRGKSTSSMIGGDESTVVYPDGTKNVYKVDVKAGGRVLQKGVALTDDEAEAAGDDMDDTPTDKEDPSRRVLFFSQEPFLRYDFDAPFVKAGLKPILISDPARMIKLLKLSVAEKAAMGSRAPVAAIMHNASGLPEKVEDIMTAAKTFISEGGLFIVAANMQNKFLKLAHPVEWECKEYGRSEFTVNSRAACLPPRGLPGRVSWKSMSLDPKTVPVSQQLLVGSPGVAFAVDLCFPGGLIYSGDVNNETSVDFITAYIRELLNVLGDMSKSMPSLVNAMMDPKKRDATIGKDDIPESEMANVAGLLNSVASAQRSGAIATDLPAEEQQILNNLMKGLMTSGGAEAASGGGKKGK